MEYKTVEINERVLIVNKVSYGPTRECDENLEGNELKINLVEVEDCPENRPCVTLDYGVSSICEHLWLYPSSTNENSDYSKKLQCKYEKDIIKKDVGQLFVKECPENKISCIGCEHLHDIKTNPKHLVELVKSHCHVICKQVEATV